MDRAQSRGAETWKAPTEPNQPVDPRYLSNLIGRLVAIGMETVRLMRELEAKVPLGIETAAEARALASVEVSK